MQFEECSACIYHDHTKDNCMITLDSPRKTGDRGMCEFYRKWVSEPMDEQTVICDSYKEIPNHEGRYHPMKDVLSKDDPVNSPSHYKVFMDIEAKDIMEHVLNSALTAGMTGYQIYCFGNILKYRLRAGDKDDLVQDIRKANKYKEMGEE